MQALEFWRRVTADKSDFLGELLEMLERNSIRYCVIGGQAVNAYVAPLVSLDLDLAIGVEDLGRAETILGAAFTLERFPQGLHLSRTNSKLRVQIQIDARYGEFVSRASVRDVLDLPLLVASKEDVLQGKIWAATDEDRLPSKRRKDLLDIERLIESYPELRARVPTGVLERLNS